MPLWLYLTALVLVPMIGVIGLTAVVARDRMAESDSATRAEQDVRVLALLDSARSAVEAEILPVLSLGVVGDPATATALGIQAGRLAGQRQTARAQKDAAQAATDRALGAVPVDSIGAAAVDRAITEIAALRAQTDAHQLAIEDVYLRYVAVSNDLMSAQTAAASAAGSEGVPGRTLRAIRDVQLTAQLSQSASRQMPLYLGSLVARGPVTLVGSMTAWKTAWLDFTYARRQMADLSQPALRAAWDRTQASDVVSTIDRAFTVSPDGTVATGPDVGRMVMLTSRSADRDRAFAALVDAAVSSAQSLAAGDRERATDRMRHTIELAAALLVVALLGVAWSGRSSSRSLGLLAGQARQISEGNLVEVEVTGPREVRTVSAALRSAVAGLRRIQDQAQAVARGDLDNALLDRPLPGPLGEVVHASVQEIVNSVREREALRFALDHQATHDPLTELPNRAQAVTLVTSALHRGQRAGQMTGLLFIDLDGFKAVNDSHGSTAGDDVLAEVARRLRRAVRPGDVVCRLGGDEFVVLVEPVKSERDLLELAERLITSISDPIRAAGHEVRVGASIGIAISRDGNADADVLFVEAGTAAYRAKQHGRGRAEIFDDDLRQQLTARAELEAAIAAALDNGEMQLYYQPVVDVGSDRITGYEALIRWNRPGRGMVPPDEFIPVAEGSTLICDLDRWVLHEATRQLAEWRGDGGPSADRPDPTVAVNISGRHLADRRVVTDVSDALVASGLPPHLLVLEVTETVLVDDPVAISHLADLREMGVGIAIDDFGTGYTSIGQLRHMPVHTLKIDRSFVASADPGHRELVALIIRAAHTFGLTVVAEGVEEPAQLARLKAQGCDKAQGYLLYRPLPAPDAGALLQAPASPARS